MHGFRGNQRLYDLLIPDLAKQHHVVSFDFVGIDWALDNDAKETARIQ
jgi:hypothetical protein